MILSSVRHFLLLIICLAFLGFFLHFADFTKAFASSVWQWQFPSTNIEQIEGLTDVTDVSIGREHSFALKADGTVWGWGNNEFGQLGDGTTNTSSKPVQVKNSDGTGFLTDVISISAGLSYSLALREDGTVWIWGRNSNGGRGTGIGNSDPSSVLMLPTQVIGTDSASFLTDIKAIVAGANHSLALRQDGKIVAWGSNNLGQLGNGCNTGNCSLIKKPILNQSISNIDTIAAGDNHSIVLKNDGTVWGWGNTLQGQLGSGIVGNQLTPIQINGLSGIKNISSKHAYNVVLDSNGRIFQWGGATVNGTYSAIEEVLGIPNPLDVSAGRTVPGYVGLALTSDGNVWQWDMEDVSTVQQVQALDNVTAIAAGFFVPNLAVAGTVTSTPTPTPSVSPTPAPFLDLPWEHGNNYFIQNAFNPNSWFDHKYPLQNVFCCTFKVQIYTGKEVNDAYRSHSGYDYSSINGVVMHTPVLAAASGSATFLPESKSGGAGHMIKIDHKNGYQTWYEHLHWDESKADHGLVVDEEDVSVEVTKGQQIGMVGMSGNTNGPHIHFSVFKDENNNRTFTDDYPYGLVDPLGWEGEDADPWTEYTNDDETKHGAQSYNLFLARVAPVLATIPSSGGLLNTDKVKVEVPSGASAVPFTLTFKDGPFESSSATLNSATPTFFLTAINSVGEKITQFLNPITITYSYKDANLLNINEDTLKLYHYNENSKVWEPLPSTLDKANKTITGQTSGFSQFALMGEVIDSQAPSTEYELDGSKGADNWYNSSVNITFNGIDNIGGLGLEYTLFKLNDEEWLEYQAPVLVESEGEHTIKYKSIDKVYNLEEQKSLEFRIDKTAPVSSASVSGTGGDDGWYRSDVFIGLSAEDEGEISKIEYSVDGGANYSVYSDPVKVSIEGTSEVLYRAVDKAGNVEVAKSLSVKIDSLAPSSLVYTTGEFGENGWFTSDVSVSLNALEGGSGYEKTFYSFDNVSFEEYLEPLTIDEEGLTKIYYYSTDKAGNKESVKEFVVKIDKTSPEVEIMYDIPALDIRIKGKDNISAIVSSLATFANSAGEVSVEDQAGNTIKVIVKDKEKGKNARLSVVSLQYNGGEVITVDQNTFSVKYDYFDVTTNTVKKFDQDWKVNDVSKLTLSYSQDNDTTTIKNRLADGSVTTMQVPNKKFLKVISEKGNLMSSY